MKKLMRKCSGMHDLCYLNGECPWCDPVEPLRYEDGTFASYEDIFEKNKDVMERLSKS